jgi:hypothetical protein
MLANKTLHTDLTKEKADAFLKEVRTMNEER